MHDGTGNDALPGSGMAEMRRALFGDDPSALAEDAFSHGPEALQVLVTEFQTSTGTTLARSELLANGVVVATQG